MACTCKRWVHIPTASEVGEGLSVAVRKDISESIASGMKEALETIAKEDARREAEMYQRFAEMQEKSDAQIKLLTALLGASSKTPAPVPPEAARPPETEPKRKKRRRLRRELRASSARPSGVVRR
jgi:hypothetical protein